MGRGGGGGGRTASRQETRYQQVVEAVDRLEVEIALHPLHLLDDVEGRVQNELVHGALFVGKLDRSARQ